MVTREELEKMSPEEIAELQKKNCIFCKLIAGEIPSNKVFEDNYVVSLLDINPAVKGHVLVMPKEHVPILPLLPPEHFKHLFIDAKLISKALKEATLSPRVTLFVANGAVAGQQASHFLFHLIPREKSDSLSNFNIIPNKDLLKFQEELFPSLKNNLSLMMQNHFKKLGIPPPTKNSSASISENVSGPVADSDNSLNNPSALSPEEAEKKRLLVLKIIDENKDARDLLKKSPEEFAELLKQNKELSEIFSGVNLKVLSEKLKQVPDSSFSNKQSSSVEELQEISDPVEESPSVSSNSNLTSLDGDSTIGESVSSDEDSLLKKIFKGSDPKQQYEILMDYFAKKPRAKDLFISDLDSFKSLLSNRPDVAKLFEDVDMDLLSDLLKNSSSTIKDSSLLDKLGRGDSSD